MVKTKYDVLGIGNAIVDILVHTDDRFLTAENLTKGAMTLVDEETANALYEKIGPAVECSGGSAANTIAALASLGGKGAFVGTVHDDQLGKVFRHDIKALGVDFNTAPTSSGLPTATCMVLVSEDGERTMQTFLGACGGLGPDDIIEDDVKAASVTYMEGYLWDPENAKKAFLKAAGIAAQAGRLVSLSLSDPFCVERHRLEFLDLAENHVDILFANEDEIMSLYQVNSFDAAVAAVRGHCKIAALTRGDKGSVIVSGDDVHEINAEPDALVVDTTGAGDAYAAGFLYGFTHDQDLPTAARIGGVASAEVISHMGARPDVSLKQLLTEKMS